MQRRRALIIDGYNVIRNNARYKTAQPDYEGGTGYNEAREALVNDAALFASGEYERCTVVFDAAANEHSTGKARKRGDVEVVFSPCGVSADSVIERLAHDAREAGLEAVVVSSDFSVQATVFGGGVTRMSAASFGHASTALEESWREDACSPKHVRTTIAERVDSSVAEKLCRLRDGA